MHEGQHSTPSDLLTPDDLARIALHKRAMRRRAIQSTALGFAIGICLVMFGLVRSSSTLDSASRGDAVLMELARSGSDLDLLGNAAAFLRLESAGDVYWRGVERLAGIVLGDDVEVSGGLRLRVAEDVLGVIDVAGGLASERAKAMEVGLAALIDLGAGVDGARAVALVADLASDLAWAIEIARTGSADDLEQSFEAYYAVTLRNHRGHPELWEGIEELAGAVLDGRLQLSARRRRHVCVLIADLIRTQKSALLFDEHVELSRRLMAPYR